MRRTVFVSWMTMAVGLGCGGGGTSGAVARDDALATEVAVETGVDDAVEAWIDQAISHEETTGDREPDLGAVDEGPFVDPGPPEDPGPALDFGPPPDPGPSPDPGPPDPGPPQDAGPQYSETVAACIYVVEGLCDKFIKRCDDMAFNWIPDEWLLACADFLAQQDALIVTACLQIDNIESSDPNVAMIKTFGPLALRECADHFECNFKTVGVIADFIMPLLQGQKVETAAILALVTDLCFQK